MKNKNVLLISLMGLIAIFGYQNCTDQGFVPLDGASVESISNIPPIAEEPPFDIGETPPFTCKRITEIPANGLLDIPARNEAGDCYIVKLISEIPTIASSNFPDQDGEVISRNHGSGEANHHPYVLGKSLLRINLRGERSVHLSGSSDGTARIAVDNFVLVGIAPSEKIGQPEFYQAFGTSDSTITNLPGKIRFKNTPIALTPFGSSGTSSVAPISLSGQMVLNKEFTLDFRALDCGSVGGVTDIYMLIK